MRITLYYSLSFLTLHCNTWNVAPIDVIPRVFARFQRSVESKHRNIAHQNNTQIIIIV